MARQQQDGKRVYRLTFHNQGQVYEIYARQVRQGPLFGFVEVEDLLFGERTELVVDPSEESLKLQFAGVKRVHIPMHAVIRIDEVEKGGPARITSAPDTRNNITTFPVPIYTPKSD